MKPIKTKQKVKNIILPKYLKSRTQSPPPQIIYRYDCSIEYSSGTIIVILLVPVPIIRLIYEGIARRTFEATAATASYRAREYLIRARGLITRQVLVSVRLRWV